MDPTIIIVIAAVLGVLLTVAGAAGVWLAMRTGQQTQTIQNFRDAAQSWREKAEATAADLEEVREELKKLRQEHTKLSLEHDALKNVVTGKAALESLGVKVDQVKQDIILEIHVNRGMLSTLLEREGGAT